MPSPSRTRSSLPNSPRLQKVLATAGFGSRRKCEQLILEGRVEVDHQVVSELGARVDAQQSQIRVDGVVVRLPSHKYFLLHKPVNVISTARDPWARTRVIDLVDDPDRLFTVGRLDKSSSGLILLTNDGDLAHRLTHPRYHVEKTYRVVVAGKPTAESLQQLRRGIRLAEGTARVERVVLKRAHATQSALEIVLTEGRNREIRRLLARVGHKVQQLKRIALGPLRLGELPVGAYRELTRAEVLQLRKCAEGENKRTGSARAKTTAAETSDTATRRPKSARRSGISKALGPAKGSGGASGSSSTRSSQRSRGPIGSTQGTVLSGSAEIPADGSTPASGKLVVARRARVPRGGRPRGTPRAAARSGRASTGRKPRRK